MRRLKTPVDTRKFHFTVAITFAIWTNFPSAWSFSTAFRALSVLSDSGSKHFSPLYNPETKRPIWMNVPFHHKNNNVSGVNSSNRDVRTDWDGILVQSPHGKVDESISFAFISFIINYCFCRHDCSKLFAHFLKILVRCLKYFVWVGARELPQGGVRELLTSADRPRM